MNNIYRVLSFFILGYFLSCMLPYYTYASSLSLGIYPPLVRIKSNETKKLFTLIQIENPTSLTTTFSISILPFSSNNTSEGMITSLNIDPSSISQENKKFIRDIEIYDNDHTVKEITLYPKQKKTLTLVVAVEKTAYAKDYYSTVLFTSKANNRNKYTSTQVRISNGIILLVCSCEKNLANNITLDSFTVPLFNNKAENFPIIISNRGAYYSNIRGEISIKDILGITERKVLLADIAILNNSTRSIPLSKKGQDVLKNLGPIGIYKATLTMYIDNIHSIKTTRIFIVFPFLYATLLLCCLYIIKKIAKNTNEKMTKLSN